MSLFFPNEKICIGKSNIYLLFYSDDEYYRLLDEILEERVKKRVGRRNPRCVKRRLRKYPTRKNGTLGLPSFERLELLSERY